MNAADAKWAYSALMQFKDVVKANPIASQVKETPAALGGKLGVIDAPAAKLSAASYSVIKSAPCDSNVYLKPLLGTSPNQAMKAIGKALVMGAFMDGKLLKEAVMALHNALGSVDGKLVTTAADYGKVIVSMPYSQVMDVFNASSKIDVTKSQRAASEGHSDGINATME